jgi:pimeloyl-ACP methyl ester carboxylesterase
MTKRICVILVLYFPIFLFAQEDTLQTNTGKIFGFLEIPEERTTVPVALIIAGSGPTNRDGNSPLLLGANNSLKYLAEGLREKGIASLRYDKRGIGKSMMLDLKESDLRFEMYVEDAAQWCRKLQKDPRFSDVIVVGHSEGSLIGMIAAREVPTEGFVSIAGTGRSAPDILYEQLKDKISPELLEETDAVMDRLIHGQTTDTIPKGLESLFRKSVQPYLISWFRYNPAREIAKLNIPVLIAQGTTDIQVGVKDAELLYQGNPSAKMIIIEGMNHVLKEVSLDQEQQIKAYSDPELPVIPQLIEEISHFIKDISGRKNSSN